ncbi:MAG: hypothetical protein KF862_06020 [Chitinophagaceae bacterium]|nr:hypothetical protein [Chitinophagaceae bacterium]
MVTTEISHFSKECNTWREALRSQREEFTRMKKELQQIAAHITGKDALMDVEHYENQFDIQLTNIHDLKKNIKAHSNTTAYQMLSSDGPPSPDVAEDHEKLAEAYRQLRGRLSELKRDFQQFLTSYA